MDLCKGAGSVSVTAEDCSIVLGSENGIAKENASNHQMFEVYGNLMI